VIIEPSISMHSILFSLPQPEDGTDKWREWRSVAQNIDTNAKQKPGVQTLGKGDFLLLPGGDLRVLAYSVTQAAESKLPYKVLVIEQATDWPVKNL
jgi:hypothetical protein